MRLEVSFSDGSLLTISEGDFIIPISTSPSVDFSTAIQLHVDITYGLTADFLDSIKDCSYFAVNTDRQKIFNSNAIVKICSID